MVNVDSNMSSIYSLFKKGIRIDNRKALEWRNIEIIPNIIETAEGSAYVKAGKSELLVGVKLSVSEPFPDTPDKGNLSVDLHLLPIADSSFELGPPSPQAVELSRVIDRALREGHALDFEKLAIVPGEKVWNVSIDIVPINFDGNLIDLGTLGALVALKNAYFPKIEEDGKVNYKEKSDEKLPMKHFPLNVTVHKIKDILYIDPTKEEELLSEVALTVGLVENEKLCSFQKHGSVPLTQKDVFEMVRIAKKAAKELRKFIV